MQGPSICARDDIQVFIKGEKNEKKSSNNRNGGSKPHRFRRYLGKCKKGLCGIDFIQSFDTSDFSVKIAAEVKDFDPALYMEKKESKRMDRYSQFALAAADIAVRDSGLDTEKVDSDRFGCIVGSAVGGIHTIEEEHAKLLKGTRQGFNLFHSHDAF